MKKGPCDGKRKTYIAGNKAASPVKGWIWERRLCICGGLKTNMFKLKRIKTFSIQILTTTNLHYLKTFARFCVKPPIKKV